MFSVILVCLVWIPRSIAGDLTWEQQDVSLTADRGTKAVETKLRFANHTQQTVRILDVKPSCGCITIELAKHIYRPGENGEIRTIFEVGDQVGREEKYVEITTDEPNPGVYRINLIITVPRWIDSTSDDLVWDISADPKPQFIRVWSPLERSLELTDIHYDHRRLEVVLQRENGGHSSYLISIRPVQTITARREPVSFHVRFNELTRDFLFYGQVRQVVTPK
jgi:hypothetical protein